MVRKTSRACLGATLAVWLAVGVIVSIIAPPNTPAHAAGLKNSVAALPFDNNTEWGAGELGTIAAELLDEALERSGAAAPVSRTVIGDAMAKRDPKRSMVETAAGISRSVHAGYAIIGSVRQLTITVKNGQAAVTTSVELSVIASTSGEVLFSERQKASFTTNNQEIASARKSDALSPDSMRQLMKPGIEALAEKVSKRFASIAWKGYVIDTRKGGEIWINAGLNLGVAKGYRFEALGKSRKIIDPDGKTLFVPGERKTLLEVVEVAAEASKVKVIEGKRVSLGNSIRFVPSKGAPAAVVTAAPAKPRAVAVKVEKIKGFHQEGVVIRIDRKKGKGLINLGAKDGVKADDKFIVVRPGERVTDPGTGAVIRVEHILVGELKIHRVTESVSDVKFARRGKGVQEGDIVRSHTSAPSGVEAKSAGFRKVEISWHPQPEPETKSFVIYRSSDGARGSFEPVGKVTKPETLSFLDRHTSKYPMEDAMTYHYRVSAVNTLGRESPLSDPVEVKTAGPPDPPGAVAAASGEIRSVTVTWAAHANVEVDGYRIYRSLKKKGPFELIKELKDRGETSFQDFNGGSATAPKLDDSTKYYYTVSAFSPFGDEGPKSKPVSATTAKPPAEVTGFEAKGWQARKVPLAWEVHPDENVRGYVIHRSETEDGEYAMIADVKGREKNSHVDGVRIGLFSEKGVLKDSQLYYYKIQAYNWAGATSKMSDVISVITKPVPAPPENVKATSGRPRQVPIVWRKNPEVGIKEYRIFRSNTPDGVFKKIGSVPADMGHFLDEGLADGTTHFYKISAVDKEKLEGEFSEVVEAMTKTVPKPVGGVGWRMEGGKAVLTWEHDSSVDVMQYIIYKKGFFGWSKVGATKENFFILNGARKGKSLIYAVSAIDADKLEGKRSEPVKVSVQ